MAEAKPHNIEHLALELLEQTHTEAVELLRDSVLQIDYMQKKFRETGTGNNLLTRLRAYLEKEERRTPYG